MKNIKIWFRAVFGFSQTEINGFVILMILMVLLMVAPFLYKNLSPQPFHDFSRDNLLLESLIAQSKLIDEEKQLDEASQFKVKQKKFKKSYPKKDPEENHHILKTENGDQLDESKPKWIENKYVKKEITPFNINSADTNTFKQLKGIGSKLALRIINYRDKLGGFYNIDQLKEVYYLDSNLIDQNIKYFLPPNNADLHTFRIDTCSVKQLVRHPYITYKEATALSNYSKQHNGVNSLEELNKIHLLKNTNLLRLLPYISFK